MLPPRPLTTQNRSHEKEPDSKGTIVLGCNRPCDSVEATFVFDCSLHGVAFTERARLPSSRLGVIVAPPSSPICVPAKVSCGHPESFEHLS